MITGPFSWIVALTGIVVGEQLRKDRQPEYNPKNYRYRQKYSTGVLILKGVSALLVVIGGFAIALSGVGGRLGSAIILLGVTYVGYRIAQ